ncbi:bifunctional adenosylcobinamide kinase/adenosylcobinamide-phosphate guanylyltransferase [Klebsiella oxytoca]|uniref:bifunctional adenosylcobinamide kinase/adenosylcobinamide-phosphate guanylyltransferase n=1 Tax=Klebsiella oxytoca TaxID=571 RepID=UPI001788E530|nr:bifunctional adenosylcobinamide kinase/adenosylcobinamide-phosphate guanylyltransferase [Klebsiella oxytoca]EKX5080972.1 bifunctional adenosylcobinamide kinase/adenosylcobinamide-phosphate guanylyltransferase [Klebsiella oxytoca]EKX5092414.1 bifunctional adenosylcobinamide kinase/adenosylcobinamide-phosphate guanylyltransferase [Klebsiella oxytoca]ELQ8987428.1 bifunctional adenosylcobinamide kinase/adenosylcobinamide-phosphate guanylyltransferase [Klebsiella oxytoca]QRS17877.1 bifunctional a
MILMTGDALSGLRRDAQSLLNSFVSAIYIATSRISDNQIAARIQHHRDTRLAHWRLEERPRSYADKSGYGRRRR